MIYLKLLHPKRRLNHLNFEQSLDSPVRLKIGCPLVSLEVSYLVFRALWCCDGSMFGPLLALSRCLLNCIMCHRYQMTALLESERQLRIGPLRATLVDAANPWSQLLY